MDTEDQPASEPDPIRVRRGSRVVHGMAGVLFVFGVGTYCFLAVGLRVLDTFDSQQVVFAPTLTLPTDTALALLGLCATVLITLVAALWASNQIPDPALARGRRRALTPLTTVTGIGSVVVGTAGGLHRPDEGWNFILAPAIFGLGLVLAYVAADVVFILREDRPLEAVLRQRDADDRRSRLRTARRNWLRRSRAASWHRGRRPTLDRVRQTGILLGLFAAGLAMALAALGGRHAVTAHLGWWLLDVTVGVLLGQLAAHYIAIKFVARRWEFFYWYCSYGLLYLPTSLLAQVPLLNSTASDWPAGKPRYAVGILFLLLCWLIPPLICLFGLTVAPRRWRRFRPLTQIRWSVIAAIGREIDLVDRGSDTEAEQTTQQSWVSRLMRAIRRATGVEEIPSQPG